MMNVDDENQIYKDYINYENQKVNKWKFVKKDINNYNDIIIETNFISYFYKKTEDEFISGFCYNKNKKSFIICSNSNKSTKSCIFINSVKIFDFLVFENFEKNGKKMRCIKIVLNK